jgi:hypothetical protein
VVVGAKGMASSSSTGRASSCITQTSSTISSVSPPGAGGSFAGVGWAPGAAEAVSVAGAGTRRAEVLRRGGAGVASGAGADRALRRRREAAVGGCSATAGSAIWPGRGPAGGGASGPPGRRRLPAGGSTAAVLAASLAPGPGAATAGSASPAIGEAGVAAGAGASPGGGVGGEGPKELAGRRRLTGGASAVAASRSRVLWLGPCQHV